MLRVGQHGGRLPFKDQSNHELMRKRFGVASGQSGALGGDSNSDEGWGDTWYPNGNINCNVEVCAETKA